MDVYNKNRDNNNSLHDEIREQNAKLKGAPFKEKLAYFKEYYLKMTLLVVAIVVFLGYLGYTMITAPSDTAFAAFFFNDAGDSSSTALADGFIEHANIDTKEYYAYIDATMSYNSEAADYDAYAGLEKTMAVIAAKELDIIVGDAQTVDYFSKAECFHDITTILPEDLLDKFKDKLYYAKVGESEDLIPVGVYITDAPKIIENYYYPHTDAILGFIANSNSIDNAVEFLRYIYLD